MASASQGPIYSGGGQVFLGDGNAGRDIVNICAFREPTLVCKANHCRCLSDHISSVGPSARTLYRSLNSSSSEQFRPVQNTLATLMGVLEFIVEDQARLEVDCNEEPTLRSLSKDCHEILNHRQELKTTL